jgi:hypothetical protein
MCCTELIRKDVGVNFSFKNNLYIFIQVVYNEMCLFE